MITQCSKWHLVPLWMLLAVAVAMPAQAQLLREEKADVSGLDVTKLMLNNDQGNWFQLYDQFNAPQPPRLLPGDGSQGLFYDEDNATIQSIICTQDMRYYLLGNSNRQSADVPFSTAHFGTVGTEAQFIYPMVNLYGLEVGDLIQSITFYVSPTYGSSLADDVANNLPDEAGGATISVSISELNSGSPTVTIADATEMAANRANLTEVYNGNLPTGSDKVTITFNQPYQYRGGRIIIDTYVTSAATMVNDCNWMGILTRQGASFYSYQATTVPEEGGDPVTETVSAQSNFLPTMTIEHTRPVKYHGFTTKEFFDNKTYEWTDIDGNTHTSKMSEVATDPDQIVALLTKVYNDTEIPGNLRRGFDRDGNFTEPYKEVSYPGIFELYHRTGDQYAFNGDAANFTSNRFGGRRLGWGTPALSAYFDGYDGIQNACYAMRNPHTLRPDVDGITLVLIEMPDDFDDYRYVLTSTAMDEYLAKYYPETMLFPNYQAYNRYYTSKIVKSARILTEAKRTGEGLDAGTLFKIDCDKMNKFYILGKGGLRIPFESTRAYASDPDQSGTTRDTYLYTAFPHFYYNPYNGREHWVEHDADYIIHHMFEQFSAYDLSTAIGNKDLYQKLINMQSLDIEHDCTSIPTTYRRDGTGVGHQFMMFDPKEDGSNCQDVRDMMFFVPDYRMMKDGNRDEARVDYFVYNLEHRPTLALYVIHQEPVTATPDKTEDDHMMLTLTWNSNLDLFMPGNEQAYDLWQVIIDEFGVEHIVPVYYMNEQDQYTDAQGNVLDDQNDESQRVQVTLSNMPTGDKTYVNVYQPRYGHSYTVTFAVSGTDIDRFLHTQMSNYQSFVIPGTDPTEMLTLQDLSHYSRFEPQELRNCYSNKIMLSNSLNGIKTEKIDAGTQLTITRQPLGGEQGTDAVTVATITFDPSQNTLTVQMANQADKALFPHAMGEESGDIAGYHANGDNVEGNSAWTHTYSVDENGYIDLERLVIFDNFVAAVGENTHPNAYRYSVTSNYTDTSVGENAAHSNYVVVPIHKTETQIGGYDQAAVDADTDHALTSSVAFKTSVQFSSKSDILRYEAYRWTESDSRYILKTAATDETEQELPPTGMAGNQGNFYTVSMNDMGSSYYATSPDVPVSPDMEQTAWASFVDNYVADDEQNGIFVYTPVVKAFSKGLNLSGQQRTDYNTYGGPAQLAPSGTMTVKAENAEMSKYSWEENGKTYCYYNIPLNVDNLNIPNGYELYKARVWRKVDPSLLNESNPNLTEAEREAHMIRLGTNGEYMYDDINNADNENISVDGINEYVFGDKEFDATYEGDLKMTFGAQKVRENDTETGVIDELPVQFTVRLYYKKDANMKNASQDGKDLTASHAVLRGDNDDESIYYIVEAIYETTIKEEDVITAINGVSVDPSRQVEQVTYYNAMGQSSSKPFNGVNIVVKEYSDGSKSSSKIIK